jgi:phosphosulfolactate synthase (CoM biosynthesis protein A)
VALARKCLEAGASLIMIESEGITENIATWRTGVASRFVNALGLDKVMFEAADAEVFGRYIKN